MQNFCHDLKRLLSRTHSYESVELVLERKSPKTEKWDYAQVFLKALVSRHLENSVHGRPRSERVADSVSKEMLVRFSEHITAGVQSQALVSLEDVAHS